MESKPDEQERAVFDQATLSPDEKKDEASKEALANKEPSERTQNEQTFPEFEENPGEPRGMWNRKVEFVLACIGYSVGLGNLWRFPYLAYENGGAAFIFTYFVLSFVIGRPLYFLDVSLGQFCSLGSIPLWNLCPVGTGIGISMCIAAVFVSIYYNVLMVYCLYYCLQSFNSVLPWSGCLEWWGANEKCYVRKAELKVCKYPRIDPIMMEYYGGNIGYEETTPKHNPPATYRNCTNATETSAEMYWERYVLALSPDISELGSIRWRLLLLLFASWTICYFCLWKGVKSTGKVVYVTATAPYVILFILFAYGVTLPGAAKGMKFFLQPKWEVFSQYQMYFRATQQVIFSFGLGFGGLITFGSYNTFHNKAHRDVLLISCMDIFTSIIAGIVVFSVLGNLATTMDVEIVDVVKSGIGLAFIIYPEALSGLWLPQLWTFLFFLMLFFLGIDSEFTLLEVPLTNLQDLYPQTRAYKTYLSLFACVICFIFGIPCVTQGGQYVLELMDTYGGGLVLVLNVTFEVIIVMWIYGVDNYSKDIEMMLGFRPGRCFRWTLAIFVPIVLIFLFVLGVAEQGRTKYGNKLFPLWADHLGIVIAFLIISPIPGFAIYRFIQHRKNPLQALRPTRDWGPTDPELKKTVQERFYPTKMEEIP